MLSELFHLFLVSLSLHWLLVHSHYPIVTVISVYEIVYDLIKRVIFMAWQLPAYKLDMENLNGISN